MALLHQPTRGPGLVALAALGITGLAALQVSAVPAAVAAPEAMVALARNIVHPQLLALAADQAAVARLPMAPVVRAECRGFMALLLAAVAQLYQAAPMAEARQARRG